ncbi:MULTISPECIES: FAD-dependent monooxygenase [unclassified Mycobacterium]|uniref:FAD-dependent monooxygenase n=1 Tax=unclassified Mycobacterium TaxID=2642494 RepID=UPI0029C7447F|nr:MULTISPECIES: FAD-dependent monooxygenase [unclassified Mycobacterium]
MTGGLDVDVLIVGGGACGLTASGLLSDLGVSHVVVEKHAETSRLPKAHYLNSRTMEIFGQLGIAERVYRDGMSLERNQTAWYTSLGGDGPTDSTQIFAIDAFGGNSLAEAYAQSSAFASCNLPQKQLEPILREHAETRNPGRIWFGHLMTSFAQDDDGVTATVVTRSTGETTTVRASYLVGADGGRTVGPALKVSMKGTEPFVRVVGIHFAADLSAYLREDDALIRRIVRLTDEGTLLQSGLVTMGPTRWDRFSEEWHVTPIVPIGAKSPVHDEASAVEHLRRVLKLPELQPKIIEISNWFVEGVVADHFRVGRVLLGGDAAHRHPPTTGLGLNSAVQDAHNLAWKLASVLRGAAGDRLLDSYERERRPVTARNVEWAMMTYFNGFATRGAWGVVPEAPPGHNADNWRRLFADTSDGASRRALLREFLQTQRAEYQARDIELGYHYADGGAVVADGTPAPARDPLGVSYIQVARPGHRVPHASLVRGGEAISTHHLLTHPGAFVLLAGADGRPWLDAAEAVERTAGVELNSWQVLGPQATDDDASALRDVRGDWRQLRGHGEAGAVLIRPDGHVAYRSANLPDEPERELTSALATVLAKSVPLSFAR